jgi:hypothetical protein
MFLVLITKNLKDLVIEILNKHRRRITPAAADRGRDDLAYLKCGCFRAILNRNAAHGG